MPIRTLWIWDDPHKYRAQHIQLKPEFIFHQIKGLPRFFKLLMKKFILAFFWCILILTEKFHLEKSKQTRNSPHYTNSQNLIISFWVCWFLGKNCLIFYLRTWNSITGIGNRIKTMNIFWYFLKKFLNSRIYSKWWSPWIYNNHFCQIPAL